MSEKNIYNEDFDLMMKSVLDDAREDVPEHVWEGVSAGLDMAARRRTVVLWWRRAAVGAAAAAVAVGVFFSHDTGQELVSPAGGSGMIAVVETAEETDGDVILTAEVREPVVPARDFVPTSAAEAAAESRTAVEAEEMVEAEMVDEAEAAVGTEEIAQTEAETTYFPEDWGQDEISDKRKTGRNVSLVLSGIAGTNNTLNQNRLNPMKAPELTSAPKRTGIEQTSVKSSYGIPLSFGIGAKIDLGRRWSIGAGVNYTFLSRQFYGKYTKVNSEGGIENSISSDISNRQHYIGIPVNVFYDIISNNTVDFYAYAGGAVEKCLSNSYNVLNTSIMHREKVSGVQLSANVGIGVEFMLGKHLGIYLDPSLRYYFENRQPESIRTAQPLMFGFELGIRARL